METKLNKSIKSPCVYCKNNIIYSVNNELVNLTGYTNNDILGKSFKELMVLLRADSQICMDYIEKISDLYIFTKEDVPKDVKIICKDLSEENEKVYFIEENRNELLKGILATVIDHDKNNREAVAIYSYPDCIHLKYNKKYMDNLILMNMEVDDLIGRVSPYLDITLSTLKEDVSYYEEEVEFTGIDGKITYWNISLILILEEGKAKYLKSSFYNQTERVVTRKLLNNQRKEMKIILDNMSDVIMKVNNEGELTYINKMAKEVLAHSSSDVTSVNSKVTFKDTNFNDMDGKQILFEDIFIERVLKGEYISNYKIIGTHQSSTSYHEVDGIPIYDELENIDGGVVIIRNINHRFKMDEYSVLEENISNLEINYATLSYVDFSIKYLNYNGFEKLKKLNMHVNSIADLIDKNFFDFYSLNDDEATRLIDNIRESIEIKSSSYVHKQKFINEGKIEYERTIFQPIFDENNQVKKISVIGIDITDEEMVNKQMAKALKAQEEIFINTSHELKTPLNLIFSASQLLSIYLKKEFIEDKKAEIINSNGVIVQNCYRITKLINNIEDVSKMEEGFYELNLCRKNIVSVIGDIVQSVSEYTKDLGIKIIFESEMEEKIMLFDLYKLERIMLNLISNSIKFTNGDVIILVNIGDKGDSIEISVKDNGIGIDKEDFDIIFKKFKQVNKSLNRSVEGTGIGLSLVKSLVELHGGDISVESVLDKGSIFRVKLPSTIVELDNEKVIQHDCYHNNMVEMIRFELSDIYS